MKLIGLAGSAGVGKDTIADYLVVNHGFTKFSFSDPLYEEVAQAFDIDKADLYNREKKEQPMEALNYWYCRDDEFRSLMFVLLEKEGIKYPTDHWPSPRWVLQRWGTDYRRAQDPQYWIRKAVAFVEAWWKQQTERQHDADYVTPGGLVNCSVRFPNERAFIQQYDGEIWHVRREGWQAAMGGDSTKNYVAEKGLDPEPQDKIINNSGTIEQLGTASSLLLGSVPGTTIVTGVEENDFLVACSACGWLHVGYTLAQAREEIATTNDVVNHMSTEARKRFPQLRIMNEGDYRVCSNCGGAEFHRAAASDLFIDAKRGQKLDPVIFEAK